MTKQAGAPEVRRLFFFFFSFSRSIGPSSRFIPVHKVVCVSIMLLCNFEQRQRSVNYFKVVCRCIIILPGLIKVSLVSDESSCKHNTLRKGAPAFLHTPLPLVVKVTSKNRGKHVVQTRALSVRAFHFPATRKSRQGRRNKNQQQAFGRQLHFAHSIFFFVNLEMFKL